MDSDTQNHPREREVFLDALEIEDLEERATFLDKAYADDAHLRSRVESLLAATEEGTIKKPLDDITDLPTVSPSGSGSGPGRWEPPSAEEVSAMLDGYEVSELLGRGGMGAVYKGVQTSLDRPVAIKLLPPELGSDAEFEARFRREAKSMARLNHPNIVQIHDFGQAAEGYHFIAMEYVDGTDLQHVIRSGKLDTEQALKAVGQICDALEYAHGEGYVHRDIKPANIFLNQKGTVKVGDFGLAKLVHEEGEESLSEQIGLTQSGMTMGTPLYIAPEQLEKGAKIDQRADIYSLGVMFYEMLTGQIPRGSVRPPSERVTKLDVRIDGIVFKAMEHDPDERYQSATDLRNEVQTIQLHKEDIANKPEARGRPAAPSGSKKPQAASTEKPSRKPTLLALAAVVLLAAAGAAYWAFQGNDDPAPSEVGTPSGAEPGDPKTEGAQPDTTGSGGGETPSTPQTSPPATTPPNGEAPVANGDFPCIKFEGKEGKPGGMLMRTLGIKDVAATSCTIETWFKPDQSNGQLAGFGGWEQIQSSSGGGGVIDYRFQKGFIDTGFARPEETKGWNHYAAVRDFEKGENRLYCNGKLTGTKPITEHQTGLREKRLREIQAGNEGRVSVPFVMGQGTHGWVGETRVSSVVRYAENFTPKRGLEPDENTVALYKFTEGEGDTLKDHSGNAHHGEAEGPIQWTVSEKSEPGTDEEVNPPPVAGEFPCIKFEGGEGNPNHIFMRTLGIKEVSATSCTIETWFKPDQGAYELAGFGGWENVQSHPGGGGVMLYRFPTESIATGFARPEETKGWNHYAAVRDFERGENRFYWNGKLMGTRPITEHQTRLREQRLREIQAGNEGRVSGPFTMGRGTHGWIGETRVSSVARYAEIFEPKRGFETDEHTVALYKFTEGEGDLLKDHSGNGHHGEAEGPITWVKVER